jgi:hypothetical protein
MKKTSNRLPCSWRSAALVAALLLSGGAFSVSHAQQSPVGIWDCVLGGSRQGTAYIDFLPDGTFTIFEVIVPNNPNQTVDTNVRNGGGNEVRTGTGFESNSVPNGQQIFGSESVTNGMWGYDLQGRTIGSFAETSFLTSCTTNAMPFFTNLDNSSLVLASPPITNNISDLLFQITTTLSTNSGPPVTYNNQVVSYTNVIVCSALTNSVSFVGRVTPNKSIMLKCSSPFGNSTYKGVPSQTLPDVSGNWSGVEVQSGVSYVEFLTLTNYPGLFPNIYFVQLQGPGYSYMGYAMLSTQKKMSFSLNRVPDSPTTPPTVVRAVTGPFNGKKIQANTKGWDQPSGPFTNPAKFTTAKSP